MLDAQKAWDASSYFGIQENSEPEDMHTHAYGREAELREAVQPPVHAFRASPVAPLMVTARLGVVTDVINTGVTGVTGMTGMSGVTVMDREIPELHQTLPDRSSVANPTAAAVHAAPLYVAAAPITEPVLACWVRHHHLGHMSLIH